jgi:hypothetical protein
MSIPYGTDYPEAPWIDRDGEPITNIDERHPDDPGPEPPPNEELVASTDVREFVVTTLSNVIPERVSWLWPGRLPVGKLVTFDGDPGVGKSTLALTFAAIVTTGGEWPDGTRCDYPGDVILMSAEDGLADTVRPRFDAAGGDPARVHAVQGVALDGTGEALRMATLADVELLRHLIKRTGARLVIIDVLMAYLPTGTDSYRDQDVRQVLARLAALAEATGCTILLLRHLNKGKGSSPLHRGGGSIGIVGASRVGLLVAPDPDDNQCHVLAAEKNNLAPIAPSLIYRLASDGMFDVAYIEWAGVSQHDACALLADRDDDGTATEAEQWLEDYLQQQGSSPSKDVKSAAWKDARIPDRTLKRAANKLHVLVESKGFPRCTWWTWPAAVGPTPFGTTGGGLTEGQGDDQQEHHESEAENPQSGQSGSIYPTDGPIGGFQPPTGPGRCPECGWHVETQGHHPECTANYDEELF